MRRINAVLLILFLLSVTFSTVFGEAAKMKVGEVVKLPKIKKESEVSIEEAIYKRRSKRSYTDKDLTREQISQLLWAAQGITDERRGFRAAPSAGACFPLEIYLVNKEGYFHYQPETHSLKVIKVGDIRSELSKACWGQKFVGEAAVSVVFAAVYERITNRYGNRGIRYTDMEVGHAAQNLHLEAVALGLGSVPVGAFEDPAIDKLLEPGKNEKILYIVPVGYVE